MTAYPNSQSNPAAAIPIWSAPNPNGWTPAAASAASIATGGTAVTVFAAGVIVNGADIINPPTATETLYIDFFGTAAAGASTSIPLTAGQGYHIAGPLATAVTAVAATSSHAFVAVRY